MIRARGVAADAEPADNLSVAVERYPTTKEDHAAGDLVRATLTTRSRQKKWIERVRLPQAPERMTGLYQRVKPRSRERGAVITERIGRICLGLGNGLAAGPDLRS